MRSHNFGMASQTPLQNTVRLLRAMREQIRAARSIGAGQHSAAMQEKLWWLINVAANRRVGMPDDFRSEIEPQQAREVQAAAIRIRKEDPELFVRTNHFSPAMRRALRTLLNGEEVYRDYWGPLPRPRESTAMRRALRG